MNNIEYYDSSASSSSSPTCSSEPTTKNPNSPSKSTSSPLVLPISSHKRKAGRKKFRETRHPVYRGIRRKNGEKWVCEVREPNKKSRIWVGTFSTPEMAARAHDVAVLALRGEMAKLNFPDSATVLPRAESSLAKDIQKAARVFSPKTTRLSSSSLSSVKFSRSSPGNVGETSSFEPKMMGVNGLDRRVLVSSKKEVFVDEEELFNMPTLIDSMAEGMLITPPAMKRGFNWDEMASCQMDMTLWGD